MNINVTSESRKKKTSSGIEQFKITHPYCVRLSNSQDITLGMMAKKAKISPQRLIQALFDSFAADKIGTAIVEVEGDSLDAKRLLTGAISFQGGIKDNIQNQGDLLKFTSEQRAQRLADFFTFICRRSNGKMIEINVGDLAKQLQTTKWYVSKMISELLKAGAVEFKPFNLIGHKSARIKAPSSTGSEYQDILSALTKVPEKVSKKDKILAHLCDLSAGKAIHVTHHNLHQQLKISPKDIAKTLSELHTQGAISLKTGRGGSKTTIVAPYSTSRAKGAAAARGISHGSGLPRNADGA